MADMMVAAGIDAAGDIEIERADLALPLGIGKTFGDPLRDRNRPCRRQAAIVHARTGR